LESLAILREQGLRVRLRAVGAFETPDYERRIKSLAEKLGVVGAVDWIGFTNDVPAELAKMNVFVLPSLFGEGLPMVILEAMAAGVPVVATRVEGAPEAIRDTLDGLLAEPNDAIDLAARIADIAEGRLDWQSLRVSAHERQSQLFSDRSMARGVAEVYRNVLASRDHKVKGSKVTEVTDGIAAPTFERIELLGTPVDNATMPEAVGAIKDRLNGSEPTQVCFVNADCINVTYRNAEYRQVLADADFVFADGIGMKIAGKVLGKSVRDNVNGTDLFPRLCMALANSGARIFLLGGRTGVADGVGRWITAHFPGLHVCGTRDGYFQAHQEPAVIQQIAESKADILLVAFGAPRQDQWIHDHLKEIGCKVAIGVGGLFDFVSGRIPRAPRWMRTCGLEWLFRLSREPRRLAKRYLIGNPVFLYHVAYERMFRQRSNMKPSGRQRPANQALESFPTQDWEVIGS
jgi:exopolysaccharide biosynthesis WecB/TagA/CpsF family protein